MQLRGIYKASMQLLFKYLNQIMFTAEYFGHISTV